MFRVTAWCVLLAACGEKASDPAPDASVPPEGLAEFDTTAVAIRGPYLQVPAPGSVVVVWATDQPATSRVEVGPDASYGREVAGRTYRYWYGADGDPPDGWLHEVRIDGLEPSSSYAYRVASLAMPVAGSLRTAPLPGESFTIAIWGDTRTNDADHAKVVAAIAADAPDVGLFTGDFVEVPASDANWNQWFTTAAPLLRIVPFYPTFGNHETILGGSRYDQSFISPPTALTDLYGEPSSRVYSFDYGDLHVTVVDAFDDPAIVMPFVDTDLASPAARAAKFRVIALHPNPYTFSYHPPDQEMRELLMPRARAAGVQLIATGHNHVYERFWLGDLHEIVAGGAGAPAHSLDVQPGLAGDTPDLRVAAATGLSYVLATFAGDLATFRAKSDTGQILDCFQIDARDQPVTNRPCP